MVVVRDTRSRDGKYVLTQYGPGDENAHFALKCNRGEPLFEYTGTLHDSFYFDADFGVPGSASNGLLAFGGLWEPIIDVWDVSTPSNSHLRKRITLYPYNEHPTRPDNNHSLHHVSFSPDGSKLAALIYKTVYIYTVATWAHIGQCTFGLPNIYDLALASHDVYEFAWAPDSRYMVVTKSNGTQDLLYFQTSPSNTTTSVCVT